MKNLVAVSSEGGSGVATEAMVRATAPIVRGIRRGIPFMGRRHVDIVPGAPRLCDAAGVTTTLVPPVHSVPLAVEPGGGRGCLAVDGRAISFLLDGTLGGDGRELPQLDGEGLTAAQRAFITRMMGTLATTISGAMRHAIGISLATLPDDDGQRSVTGPMVALTLRFEGRIEDAEEDDPEEFLFADMDEDEDDPSPSIDTFGTMVLSVAKSALVTARRREVRPLAVANPRVMGSLELTQVELAAELGRMTLPLGDLLRMRPGDTLRLPVAVGSAVDLRVGTQRLLKAHPTTSGSQLAVRIAGAESPPSTVEP
ncbi:MAG: FliM/FliN family flagellar motor switch protein [Myxococcota bacterium]